MENISREQIRAEFNKLTPAQKEVFLSEESAQVISLLGDSLHLNRHSKGMLALEMSYFVLGLRTEEGIARELMHNLEIDTTAVKKILDQVKNTIITKMSQAAKEVQIDTDEINEDGDEEVDPYREPFGREEEPEAIYNEPEEEESHEEEHMPEHEVSDVENMPQLTDIDQEIATLKGKVHALERESEDESADNMTRLVVAKNIKDIEDKIEKLEAKRENIIWSKY